MNTPNGDSSQMDDAYSLLGESRRRFLLYQLRENEYGNIDELSLQIAAWERDESISAVSEDDRQDVYVSLIHNHLPRLADHDVVEYDLRSGDIVLAKNFAALEALLEQFKRTEEVSEDRLSTSHVTHRH